MTRDLLADYSPSNDRYDEMLAGPAVARPHWQRLFDQLQGTSPDAMRELSQWVQRQVRENGVTYNVYAEAEGADRPWELDLLPLVIPPDEWAGIERAVVQRATLLNRILCDVYGEQRLIAEGLLPAPLVYGHAGFLRPCSGIKAPGNTMLHLYAERKARGEAPAPPPAVVVAPKPAAPDQQQVELVFWESIKGSANVADFAAYLERYPQGSFVALAKNRIAQLAPKAVAATAVAAAPAPAPTPAPVPAPATPVPATAPTASIATLPAQVASIAPAPGPARPGMPKAGDRWTYRYTNPARPEQASTIAIEVKAAAGDAILESASRSDGKVSDWAFGPGAYLIGFDTMTTLAPYLAAFGELREGRSWSDIEFQRMGNCSDGRAQCRALGKVVGREKVTTSAGTFDAVRVEVTITGSMFGRPATLGSTDFVYWYAEAAKRFVKASARSFNTPRPDFDVELVSYQLN